MNIKQCFEILEISSGATYEEAKTAYHLMCQVWHPDKYNHNEKLHAKATCKIKEINAAWNQIEDYFKNGTAKETKTHKADPRAHDERDKAQHAEQERMRKEATNDTKYNQQHKQANQTSQTSYKPTARASLNSVSKIIYIGIAVIFVVAIFNGRKKEEAPATAYESPRPVYIDRQTRTLPTTTAVKTTTPVAERTTTSNLSSEEKTSLSLACLVAQSEGPAAYNQCVKQQLSARRSRGTPDTSSFSPEEKSSLSLACLVAQTEGPATYNRCVSQQLSAMKNN